jgi:hypothetical protein
VDSGATYCIKAIGVDTERVGSRDDVPSAGISGQRDRRKSKLYDKNFDYVDDIGVCTPVSDSVRGDHVNIKIDMVDPVIKWWRSDHGLQSRSVG